MTVRENILFSMKIRKTGGDDIGKKVSELVDILSISHLMTRNPATLSGGEA